MFRSIPVSGHVEKDWKDTDQTINKGYPWREWWNGKKASK